MRKITTNCIALGKVVQKPNIQISFISYLLKGKKNVLIDTVPPKAAEKWHQELLTALDGKPIDAIIINHSEEDHSGALPLILEMLPEIPVYCTSACRDRLQVACPTANFVCVSHGSIAQIGDFSFQFLHTPGLHWDDNMVTFLENEKLLFSNDLFGQYIGCESFVDETLTADELVAGAASYFENLFAAAPAKQKQVLTEIIKLDFLHIAPGHGVVIEKNIPELLAFYSAKCIA